MTARQASRCTLLVAAYACAVLQPLVGATQLADSLFDRLSHPAIRYGAEPARDPVSELRRNVLDKRVRLDPDSELKYLRSLLRALNVSETSQIMVFSKTSLQRQIISAQNPRAIYFNDDVAVALVPGGFVEFASQDPQQGVQFFSSHANNPLPAVRSKETGGCLSCHHSYRTAGVPGMIEPMTHRRPLEERWGGWYVTGYLGSVRHFGNVDIGASTGPPAEASFNWPSLEGKIDTSRYLSPYSDVVAHLVFEHQMHMMNLITRVGWESRVAEQERTSNAWGVVAKAIDELVDYMVFVDETPLRTTLRGTAGFGEMFSGRGPSDSGGRSLRQLDLTNRLMRYPCSYMIYSRQFESLSQPVRTAIYARLWAILSGVDGAPKYAHLTRPDRQAIVEILRATKKDLPADYSRSIRR